MTWSELLPRLEASLNIVNLFVQNVILAVVAVPEGIRLAVTLALVLATELMTKGNLLVLDHARSASLFSSLMRTLVRAGDEYMSRQGFSVDISS